MLKASTASKVSKNIYVSNLSLSSFSNYYKVGCSKIDQTYCECLVVAFFPSKLNQVKDLCTIRSILLEIIRSHSDNNKISLFWLLECKLKGLMNSSILFTFEHSTLK